MATNWQGAFGPQSVWGLQDNVLDHIENILEARVAAEYHFLEKIGQELTSINSSLDALLHPTRVVKGKLESEPNPLAELWRSTFVGQFISQFVSLIEDGQRHLLYQLYSLILFILLEFTSGKSLYERLRQELETFRTGAQAIKNSRPITADVDQLEQSLVTAVRRCDNAREIYASRCKVRAIVHTFSFEFISFLGISKCKHKTKEPVRVIEKQ
ncbi:hypothetical protein FRC16_004474 [Serendipita sp. 398]|nr:hypothetical protein FRC16_004474 [Serendipita sp. 398]